MHRHIVKEREISYLQWSKAFTKLLLKAVPAPAHISEIGHVTTGHDISTLYIHRILNYRNGSA